MPCAHIPERSAAVGLFNGPLRRLSQTICYPTCHGCNEISICLIIRVIRAPAKKGLHSTKQFRLIDCMVLNPFSTVF